jgi:hypothetical protein
MKSRSLTARFINVHAPDSFSSRARQKRWEYFRELAGSVERPVKILDVGGTDTVWERIGLAGQSDVHITLLNIYDVSTKYTNITSVMGTACSMPQFADKEFDIVFSNSVIEHVGGDREIRQMADEIVRVGKKYYIQTPNRYFPIEPHFFFPWFQFLPVSVRATLVQNFQLGWRPKCPDRAQAEAEARSIHLLSKREMKALFPGAHLIEERVFGLTKSFQLHNFSS